MLMGQNYNDRQGEFPRQPPGGRGGPSALQANVPDRGLNQTLPMAPGTMGPSFDELLWSGVLGQIPNELKMQILQARQSGNVQAMNELIYSQGLGQVPNEFKLALSQAGSSPPSLPPSRPATRPPTATPGGPTPAPAPAPGTMAPGYYPGGPTASGGGNTPLAPSMGPGGMYNDSFGGMNPQVSAMMQSLPPDVQRAVAERMSSQGPVNGTLYGGPQQVSDRARLGTPMGGQPTQMPPQGGAMGGGNPNYGDPWGGRQPVRATPGGSSGGAWPGGGGTPPNPGPPMPPQGGGGPGWSGSGGGKPVTQVPPSPPTPSTAGGWSFSADVQGSADTAPNAQRGVPTPGPSWSSSKPRPQTDPAEKARRNKRKMDRPRTGGNYGPKTRPAASE